MIAASARHPQCVSMPGNRQQDGTTCLVMQVYPPYTRVPRVGARVPRRKTW